MKLNPNCPVDEINKKKYESFIERIKEPMDNSKLPDLYCVLLQASFELDENKDFFSKNLLGRFTSKLISKTLSEGWAIIGCFERAAFLSNYHHTRAALELTASYHWVTYKKEKTENRIKKFFEFDELFLYQLYMKYKDSQKKEDNLFLEYFTKEKIEHLKSKIPFWIELYKPKDNNLLKISNWHYGALIENILSEFPDKRLEMFYDEFSHATHFSPLSHKLGTEDTVLGFPINLDYDLSELNKPIIIYLDSFEFLLSLVNNSISFNSKVKFPRYVEK